MTDLSLQVKNVLREHDPSYAKFYDRDVLRQIHSKQDYVKRLEALSEQFWDSLDTLIPFARLWPAILIGTFLRLSNLHYPEEMTRYLRRVKATMVYIIGPLPRLIPRGSCEDTKYLEPYIRILKKVLPGKTYRVLWLLTLRHFPEIDGQAPRKDIALGNGYKRIRKLYRDRKAADSSEIEDCVRRIRPSIEQEVRRRKVQLIYQIIGDLECGETMTAAPELTSDREDGRPDISDKYSRPDISYRYGRPHDSALQADEGCLFFDYIYLTSYDTTPKRYLTSFAITRDFFHSFFGTAKDDLDQPNFFRLPRDNHGGGREDEERMQDVEDVEGPPANQRSAPPPPPEVPLPSNPTRPVENTHSAVTTSGSPGGAALLALPLIRTA
ncbi:hypothetical protein G7Y89_g8099 [Cudoniella acicularis]|uniref:Uncharacterized protein n=1 Tax=Cudoniella acicularis TaxID=354080 RepID=A0A8H4RHA2_9HELO|nr:hypothetical protein G7Y89_g8099 [Cudoniella acicularis]